MLLHWQLVRAGGLILGLALMFLSPAVTNASHPPYPHPHPAAQSQRQEDFEQGIARMAEQLVRAVPGRTVAVFEFPDLESRISNLGRLVSEQLTTELVQRAGTQGRIVERRQVLQVLTELDLLKTDLTGADVSRVGRQLGADAIVLGTASVVGNRIMVNARVVGVSGGQVLAADRMSVPGPPEFLALAAAGIGAPTLTPRAPTPRQPAGVAAEGTAGNPPLAETRVKSVHAQVRRCVQAGEAVTCHLVLTNDGPDTDLSLDSHIMPVFSSNGGDTRIVDGSGNVYRVSKLRIANREGDQSVESTLVSGVATAGSVTFDGVQPGTSRISVLEIRGKLASSPEPWIVLRFRDLPVTR
jgi:TolB-like protein